MRLSAGISTPNSLGILSFGFRISTLRFSFYPWRCLWRGFLSQITRTTFLRFTILHPSQSLFTDGRTFIVHETKNAEPISALAMAKSDSPLRQIVRGNL